MIDKVDLKNFSLDQLVDYVRELGLPSFRAGQLFSWIYRPGITGFEQMTDIAMELRQDLAGQAVFSRFESLLREKSRDGTVKYGFRLNDGLLIESVLIPDDDRHTLCLSSQAGCAMGCVFCLTATMGLRRNLSPAEIVNQVGAVRDEMLKQDQGGITNLVFMGMGEPLANFNNLVTAISILTEQRGLDFSDRRITVSTCGLAPKIRELGLKTKVNLAVSLHSVRDEVRSRLMPINKTYGVDELLAACRDFPMPRRKRIMFEYIMLDGINDSDQDARLLADKLKDIRCKINLLPYNQTKELPYRRSPAQRIERFQKILWQAGYTVLVRTSRGSDISAACGQLAGKQQD
ncbi:MAG: 23S rRNA (adenine(2503)-C(2))-methyltransferase RlmN [Desulfobacterales bacterium]|nr:23S rRNA (adenine(2503)-C(2))-methyltransferase RlmN [Desulfobacterales bacterium]